MHGRICLARPALAFYDAVHANDLPVHAATLLRSHNVWQVHRGESNTPVQVSQSALGGRLQSRLRSNSLELGSHVD